VIGRERRGHVRSFHERRSISTRRVCVRNVYPPRVDCHMFTMMCVCVTVRAYVMELCLVSTQRVLVQATGSAQKGGQVQQLSVPRVHQASQQVHSAVRTYRQCCEHTSDLLTIIFRSTSLAFRRPVLCFLHQSFID